MIERDPWLENFRRRSTESERSFQAWLRRYDRRLVYYIIGIGLIWAGVGVAIKLLP